MTLVSFFSRLCETSFWSTVNKYIIIILYETFFWSTVNKYIITIMIIIKITNVKGLLERHFCGNSINSF